MDLQQQNKLLYARAGFGILINDYHNPLPVKEAVEKLFPKSLPGVLEMITDQEWADNTPKAMKEIADDSLRKQKQKEFREITNDLNTLWEMAMVNSYYPLLEKTALFWHGHFATHIDNPYYDQNLLHIFRKNALGNFGDMLRDVSKSPAMLQYLNNRQNRKQHPNENFAREVMELFTLGRGHYTEDDIKEAARAFTGWNFTDEGEFIFREKQHDDGEKKFLGKTGNFTGDDILNIVLEQKQTSVFITQKLYRFFVSDELINDKHVNELAKHFYKSNYDIGSLLRKLFTSDWFYNDKTIGAKIKSPVELLVGYQRMLPMQFDKDNTILNLQRILGQHLFNPPNVAGWPGGKNWIDSSSLVIRMRLPEALFGTKELNLATKDNDKEIAGTMKMGKGKDKTTDKQFRVGKVAVKWDDYLNIWKKYNRQELPGLLAGFLLPFPLPDDKLTDVISCADSSSDDSFIKSLTILFMELPEYQLV